MFAPSMRGGRRTPILLSVAWPFIAGLASCAAIAHAASAPDGAQLPLGRVRVLRAPISCEGSCSYELEVECPELREPARVEVKVGEPTGEPRQGTILFATGHFGEYDFSGREETIRILAELRGAGFRTVELKWLTVWFMSAPGEEAGLVRMGCRPATVARWVYDNLYSRDANRAFCATGHSNGASQIAYMVTHYGLAPLFSLLVLEGGPNWTQLEAGCLQEDPDTGSMWFSRDDRGSVDLAFGYRDGAEGPCRRRDVSFRHRLRQESLHFARGNYVYPKTMIWFLFGGSDTSSTRAQGELFYEDLRRKGTPLLRRTLVPAAPHAVFKVPVGADIHRSVLMTECFPR